MPLTERSRRELCFSFAVRKSIRSDEEEAPPLSPSPSPLLSPSLSRPSRPSSLTLLSTLNTSDRRGLFGSVRGFTFFNVIGMSILITTLVEGEER